MTLFEGSVAVESVPRILVKLPSSAKLFENAFALPTSHADLVGDNRLDMRGIHGSGINGWRVVNRLLGEGVCWA